MSQRVRDVALLIVAGLFAGSLSGCLELVVEQSLSPRSWRLAILSARPRRQVC